MSETEDTTSDSDRDLIRSLADYHRFIEADMEARSQRNVMFCSMRRPILHYQLMLRRLEYLINTKTDPVSKLRIKAEQFRFKRAGMYLGLLVPPNVVGPGLVLRHQGALTVSSSAIIGANAKINAGVNITGKVTIGKNVMIGPGASISGDATIGDDVRIAPNSLVIMDDPELD